MVAPAIDIPTLDIAVLQRHHIRRLSLFGSVLRQDFRPASDIDVLVEFAPGQTPGLKLIDMQDELSQMLGGRAVDMVTKKFLNHRIRNSVLGSAMVVYEE